MMMSRKRTHGRGVPRPVAQTIQIYRWLAASAIGAAAMNQYRRRLERRSAKARDEPMRVLLIVFICSWVVTACAGKPIASPPLATTYVSANGNPLAAAPIGADGTLDEKALAEAKKAGYKLVNTNGQLLYCRTDVKLGTHIQRNGDTTCRTAQEMIEIHEQTRHSLEQYVPSHLGSH
jgi:hypothetical protein